jgi:hypothetical protein
MFCIIVQQGNNSQFSFKCFRNTSSTSQDERKRNKQTTGEMESTLARYERELHGMRHVIHGGRWGSSMQYHASAG